ncbi:MAG TPA: hypothetical protein VKV29_12595 [Chthonomonas sp.]|uniref:hypothetical protein n=1 Tax=Chthonomonas sp. TaxID=2282153 RepID=UPI002B4B152A|nr:hypothetical protein [Chthonomonas sp.]HLH81106.1 hypothetical protein [Chthonomonas sp.]
MNQQAPKLHLPFEYFSWRGHAWRDLFGLLFLTGYLLKNAFALKTISPPLLVNWAILAILLVYLWRAILRGLTTRIRLTSTSLSEKTLFGTTAIPLEKLFAVTVVKTPSPLWTTSVKALLVRGMGERLLLPLPVPEEIIAVLRLHNERLFVCELPPETPREVALREELLDLLTHEGIVTSGADRLDEPRREAPWLLSATVRNLLLGIDGLALAAFLLYGSVVKAHSFWMVSVLFWIVTGATGGLLWYNQARERACEQALQEEEGF